MDTDDERRKKERELADKRFNREEMGELLRLFSALGITVALGITGFFLAGLWADRALTAEGWKTYGLGRVGGVVLGLGLSFYWAYLRIVKHLRKYEPPAPGDEADGDEDREA